MPYIISHTENVCSHSRFCELAETSLCASVMASTSCAIVLLLPSDRQSIRCCGKISAERTGGALSVGELSTAGFEPNCSTSKPFCSEQANKKAEYHTRTLDESY